MWYPEGMVSRRALALIPFPVAQLVRQELFRSESNLVMVRFSAMRGKNFITDLKAEDVVLAEDGLPQRIALFEGPLRGWQEKQEVDFRVLVDLSGTALRFKPLTGELLGRTLIESIRRRAAVSIYAFAYDCRKLAGPTRDAAELNRGIGQLANVDVRQGLPSASRIFDSVVQVAGEVDTQAAQTHPVLVVFSDGLNDGNRKTLSDAIETALRVGMTVYPVLLANPGERDNREAELIEEYARMGPATGGRSFWPPAVTQQHLGRILEHVATQVRAEYTLGYYRSAGEGKGRVRTVSVKLKKRERGTLQGGIRRVVM